jgi:hypothetical protein
MSYLGRSAKLSLKAQEKVSFLATAGQTSKTGLSYVPSFVEVYVNGVLLTDTTDFTATNGNSITFTVALLLNDEVTVISLKTFTVADHYTKSDADTLLAAKLPLAGGTMTGALDVNAAATLGGGTDEIQIIGGGGTARVDAIGGNTNVNLSLSTKGTGKVYFWRGGYGGTQMALLDSDGLKFNGDTAAANALDDFETGSWTPRIKSNTGEGSGTAYSNQAGRYTKIGDTVHCDFNCDVSTEGSFSGNYLQLAGFPFNISNNVTTVHLGNVYFYGLDQSIISLGLQAEQGQAHAYLWMKSGASTSREYLSLTGLGTAQITGSFSYKV